MPKDTGKIRLLNLRDLASFRNEEEKKKCEGKYIATKSFRNNEVLRNEREEPIANVDPADTLEKARRMGHKDPVIFYYPDSSKRHAFLTPAK